MNKVLWTQKDSNPHYIDPKSIASANWATHP